MENYEKKHQEDLESAKGWLAIAKENDNKLAIQIIEKFFPELADSEDEKWRKWLIGHLSGYINQTDDKYAEVCKKAIAWLEKQGEQNPTDKVEPKFKVGDWIVNNDKRIAVPTQILNIEEYGYTTSRGYTSFDKVKADYHLWTIQDAKDGDVLSYVTDEEGLWIMIYKSLYEHYEGHVHYHALILNNDYIDRGTCCISVEDLNPATKEQRDILERAMTNAGYRWNKEELKLEKI